MVGMDAEGRNATQERTDLVRMRRSDEQDGTGLGHAPGASRNDFAEEGVDDVADRVEEQIVLPGRHGIELLLRGMLLLDDRRGRRRRRRRLRQRRGRSAIFGRHGAG